LTSLRKANDASRGMKKSVAALSLVGGLILSDSLWAAGYYGSLQYSNPASGVTNIVFQSADSKKLCKALNDNFLRGLRTTCPQCRVELSGCDTALPSAYRYIFNDQPMHFPYVSAPYTRIVVFGVPIEQSRAICREMAQRWQEGMNQPARCITK
jgi:hypothetical protein